MVFLTASPDMKESVDTDASTIDSASQAQSHDDGWLAWLLSSGLPPSLG